MELSIGNFFFRQRSHDNWTDVVIGFASRPNGGLARRETALKFGLRSDHALELLSVENPADRYVAPDGSITYGRICIQGANQYALSAEQVFTAQLFDRTQRAARLQAESELQRRLADAVPPVIDLNAGLAMG